MKKQLLALLITLLSTTTVFQPVHAEGPVKKGVRAFGRIVETAMGFVIILVGGGVIVLTHKECRDPLTTAASSVIGVPIALVGALIMENGIEGFNKVMNKKHKPKHHHNHHGDHHERERVNVIINTDE